MSVKSLIRLGGSPGALQELAQFVQMTDAQRSAAYATALGVGNGKAVRDTVAGFLIPFELGPDNKIVVPCRIVTGATGGGAPALATAVKQITRNYVFDTMPSGGFEEPVFAEAFKRAARVSLKALTGSSVQRTSRITGRKYSAKNSDSISQVFGTQPTTAQADVLQDYTAVKTAAKTWANTDPDKSYKMTPEGSR